MTFPVAGCKSWGSELWRKLGGVRQLEINSRWMTLLTGTRLPLPCGSPWESLRRSLETDPAAEESTPARRVPDQRRPIVSGEGAQARASGKLPLPQPRPKPFRARRDDGRRPAGRGGSPRPERVRLNTFERPSADMARELLMSLAPADASPIAGSQESLTAPGARNLIVSMLSNVVTRAITAVTETSLNANLARKLAATLNGRAARKNAAWAQAPALDPTDTDRIVDAAMFADLAGTQAPLETLTGQPGNGSDPPRPTPQGGRKPPEFNEPLKPRELQAAFDRIKPRSSRPVYTESPEEPFALPSSLPEDAPFHPFGLSSKDSAPAPDVPVSVTPGGAGSVTRISPPLATPVMPPLMPGKVTQPPAHGLTGPTTRIMTRAEDSEPEDLGDLAEKLRLILQEEARRHGIHA